MIIRMALPRRGSKGGWPGAVGRSWGGVGNCFPRMYIMRQLGPCLDDVFFDNPNVLRLVKHGLTYFQHILQIGHSMFSKSQQIVIYVSEYALGQ